jgi:hypothetical protein
MGIRESGKTYGATKLAEEMVMAGGQIVALDPVGKWWGMRVNKDGKGPGLDIPVLGGLRGDLPLHESSGRLVAKTVIETGTSVILDVSQMRKGKRKHFVTEFCEELYHLRATHPAATHVFFEEAHTFAPQQSSGQERMLGAVSDIVRLGRNHGLGATLIDQRPQSVNKDVLNQTECLFAMRMVGKHERKAIQDWIVHAGIDVGTMADELPSLETGESMLWSPSWLRLFKRIKILPKKTFDASATPKVGKKHKATKLKSLNLEHLESAMADMVKEVEDNDPKALKARVRRLEAELAKERSKPTGATEQQLNEMSALGVGRGYAMAGQDFKKYVFGDVFLSLRALLAKAVDDGLMETQSKAASDMDAMLDAFAKSRAKKVKRKPVPRGNVIELKGKIIRTPGSYVASHGEVSGIEQKILDAIAWWERIGVPEPSRRQVGFVAGYTMNGYFNNTISKMKTGHLIEYPGAGQIAMLDRGRQCARFPDVPPTQEELHRRVFDQLQGIQLKLLQACIDCYPRSVDRAELADRCGYTLNGYFNNTVSSMKTMGFISYPEKGQVAATDLLFL